MDFLKLSNILLLLKMLLPVNCKNQATVNYSILNRFKPAYIYRFFCLSLSRDDWYNVRITLDELKRTCGDKLGSFNNGI